MTVGELREWLGDLPQEVEIEVDFINGEFLTPGSITGVGMGSSTAFIVADADFLRPPTPRPQRVPGGKPDKPSGWLQLHAGQGIVKR